MYATSATPAKLMPKLSPTMTSAKRGMLVPANARVAYAAIAAACTMPPMTSARMKPSFSEQNPPAAMPANVAMSPIEPRTAPTVFYHDIGLSKETVGAVRGSIGLIATFAGIAAGGFCSLKLGFMRALVIGGIVQAAAIAAYATLAFAGTSIPLFALVMVGDNFGISFAGVALVAYMSSLTNLGYTATQYALLSSTYSWLGKILKGFSGAAVESLSTRHGLIHAYGIFFIACGLTGVPAVLLFAALGYWHRRKQPAPAAA